VLADIHDLAGRWGRVRLVRHDGGLALESGDPLLLVELARNAAVNMYLGPALSSHALAVPIQFRGVLKQALTTVGWPVEDLAGYTTGTPLAIGLRLDRFSLRDYQIDAAEARPRGPRLDRRGRLHRDPLPATARDTYGVRDRSAA
jgi:DNA excision repair protein ERCC-3